MLTKSLHDISAIHLGTEFWKLVLRDFGRIRPNGYSLPIMNRSDTGWSTGTKDNLLSIHKKFGHVMIIEVSHLPLFLLQG